MNPGDVVRHQKFGKGVILDPTVSRGGSEHANVDFDYMVTEAPIESLTLLKDEAAPTAPVAEALPRPGIISQTALDARRSIVALRLGQVLEDDVVELSVGVEDHDARFRAMVRQAVEERTPRGVVVEGPWGAGKTHLLTLLTAIAREANFATSHVILDGESVSLSRPMELMEEVLSNLRFPSETIPTRLWHKMSKFRRDHRDDVHVRRLLGGRLADAIFRVPVEKMEEAEVAEVFEDYLCLALPASQARHRFRKLGVFGVTGLPAISARAVADRPGRFSELIHGWTGFCCLDGATGLLVVFDEVDVEYASYWGGHFARNRLNLLCELAKLRNIPLLLAFGSAPLTEGRGADVDAHRELLDHLPRAGYVPAHEPTVEQVIELGRRIKGVYVKAYPGGMKGIDNEYVENLIDQYAYEFYRTEMDPRPRGFIRGTLERLDLVQELKTAPVNGRSQSEGEGD